VQFTIPRQGLLDTLKAVKHAVSPRVTLPILGNVLIKATSSDEVLLTATDLDLTIRRTVPASVHRCGQTTIPFRLLHDYVAAGGGSDLTFDLDGETEVTTITSGKRTARLHGVIVAEFPRRLEENEPTASTVIEAEDLLRNIGRVVVSASSDEARPVLTGVLLSTDKCALRMAATDGHRLTVATTQCTQPLAKPLLIPARHMAIVTKLLGKFDGEVTIAQMGFHAKLSFGNLTEVFSRVIDGAYPNYEQVIPARYQTTMVVDASELVAEAKVMSIMAKDAANVLWLRRENGSLQILAETAEVGSAETSIPAESTGADDAQIAVSAKLLLDAVTSLQAERVRIGLNGPLSPLTVQSHPMDGAIVVVMPVRVPA